MEPVTHVLTGACLARAGFNRKAAYATMAMAGAAEFADIDTLWGLRGPISGFEHHRGITHSFVGVPLEAALLLFFVFLFHRWRHHRTGAVVDPPGRLLSQAPVRWGLLYLFLLIALLSHLLLDYTNNYGLRPFLPFDSRWYAASIVFIFDPLIFILLLLGLFLPTLFGLIAGEVGARKRPFQGAGWARAALLGMLMLWTVRAYEHTEAVALAEAQTLKAPAEEPAQAAQSDDLSPSAGTRNDEALPEPSRPLLIAQKTVATPDPFNIFRWYTATDFGPAYRLGTADTHARTLAPGQILTKPSPNPVLTAAEASHLGRVYLDWSPMPWLSVSGPALPSTSLPANGTNAVSFQDLRFMGSSTFLRENGKAPLTGQVVLDRAGRVLEQSMDGHSGR